MENAAEALKMAGAVLIFVLAISIIIFAFGQVRETSDTILNYKDRETEYISDEENHYYQTIDRERVVGLETVIPSIFRAYLEQYKIVFEGLNEPLFYVKDKLTGQYDIPKYTLDLETGKNEIYTNPNLGTNEMKRAFLSGIVYGDFSSKVLENNNNSLLNNTKLGFERKFLVELKNLSPLYNRLQNRTIIEYLGVYYPEDNPNKAEVNLQEKRIITYRIQ
ncbi:MAG: hypothetical protein HFJ59_06875 [Clostridia bacterium]|nr:hypothetical protein [Clostridia bacterium]